jgi:hypothetical protein
MGAAVSAVGLSAGATLAAHGPLLIVNDRLSAVATGLRPSVDAALGSPRWAAIGISLALIVVVLAGGSPLKERPGSWSWGVTGIALGTVGVLAWLTGSPAGWAWGLSITGPSRSLLEMTVLGMPSAAGWGTAMVVGIPVGAWLSARTRGAIAWRRPSWPDTIRRFAGGALMGIGGTLAAGCNIGNALTGLSVLALNSVLATAAIVGGAAVALAATGMRRPAPGFKK